MRVRVHIQTTPELPDTKRLIRMIRSGVGRAAKGTRTELVRAIRKEVPKLRASKVRGDIKIIRASEAPSAMLRVVDKPVSLKSVARGRPRKVKGNGDTPGGLRVQIGPQRSLDIPRAFVPKGGAQNEIFMRRGAARLPIRKLMAPSTRDLAIAVWDDVRPAAQERMHTEIRRALHRVGYRSTK